MSKPLELVLESEVALNVPIKASRVRAQNGLSHTGNSKYTMTAEDIGNLPAGEATPLNDVLLQMPGVALDQNQEIHIRGEHAGIQYQMNNIMLPLDINNDPTFTQLLNSYFVSSVSLIDGVLPAQYGYRTSGVDRNPDQERMRRWPQQFQRVRRHVRYCGAEFSASRMRWQVQLLSDRPLFAFQSGAEFRHSGPRSDS